MAFTSNRNFFFFSDLTLVIFGLHRNIKLEHISQFSTTPQTKTKSHIMRNFLPAQRDVLAWGSTCGWHLNSKLD